MSTIATPRDLSRRGSSMNVTTPTSSTRPSLEASRSRTSSPSSKPPPVSSPNLSSTAPAKRNRAALREYYNLKKPPSSPHPPTPTLEITPDAGSASVPLPSPGLTSASDVPASDLDSANFDPAKSVQRTLRDSSLADLLRAHARVLGEIRALDAERKGLVYDNYSRLISATETIRRMRAEDGAAGDPATAGRTLGPAVADVYAQAKGVRDEARRVVGEEQGVDEGDEKRRRTKEVAALVVAAVEEVKALAKDGNMEEAEAMWEMPRRVLVRWKERGVGGADVGVLLEEGDAALRKEEDE